MEGRFNGVFFARPVWGTYIWRGLFSEFDCLQSVPHLRRSIRGLEPYDAEVKRSLVKNDVAVLVLFVVHCASACDVSTLYPDRTQFFPLNSCVSDVKAHLRELQTTQSCVASERESYTRACACRFV